jgi:murein endopeptidase
MSSSPKKRRSNSKQSRKSAADMVSTKTTTVEPRQDKIWTEREIAAMSLDEFDRFESEIDQAVTEGRVVK